LLQQKSIQGQNSFADFNQYLSFRRLATTGFETITDDQ